MGGEGSTRWERYRKKPLVEACLPLDVAYLARAIPFITDGGERAGTLSWPRVGRDGEEPACQFTVKTTREEGWIELSYVVGATGEPVRQRMALTTTQPPFGGVRWWAWCPVCGARRRIVYLPPGRCLFGCRACHQLTYRSSQEAHRFDRGIYAAVARDFGIPSEPWTRQLRQLTRGEHEKIL